MTAVASETVRHEAAAAASPALGRRAARTVADTLLLTRRNLLHYVRVPQLIVFAIVQPIMFTVLFVYVFGGAIATPNGSYVDYLIPGIIVQTIVFGAMGSGVNMAEDLEKGVMDRFRSLPIARGTVLAARVLSDTVRNVVSVFIMVGVGAIMGYRYHGNVEGAVLGLILTVLVGLAFSWIATTIGLLVRDTQTAEIAGFTWVFPLVFASSIFVPIASMQQAWLRTFAQDNPITLAANAVRSYSLGQAAGDAPWQAALWCVAIIAVFGPISVAALRRLK
jgi:ABC-2 type transport system permease protein/oleandomycin transport system permease protein